MRLNGDPSQDLTVPGLCSLGRWYRHKHDGAEGNGDWRMSF